VAITQAMALTESGRERRGTIPCTTPCNLQRQHTTNDHYADFQKTLDFLLSDPSKQAELQNRWVLLLPKY
jgi:hypothetical protein